MFINKAILFMRTGAKLGIVVIMVFIVYFIDKEIDENNVYI
jgi:uncharacterized membrane protein